MSAPASPLRPGRVRLHCVVEASLTGGDARRVYDILDTKEPWREVPQRDSGGTDQHGGLLVTEATSGDSYIGHFRDFGWVLAFLCQMRARLLWVEGLAEA